MTIFEAMAVAAAILGVSLTISGLSVGLTRLCVWLDSRFGWVAPAALVGTIAFAAFTVSIWAVSQ